MGQHIAYMLSALYAHPSVCPSFARVDQPKAVEVRIMKFTPYSSPIPLVMRGKFHPEILTGSPERGVKHGRGAKTSHFLALNFITSTSRKR